MMSRERASGRFERVPRTGTAAQVTAFVVCGGWLAGLLIGSGSSIDWSSPITWLVVALPAVLLLRSLFFGVYLNADQLRIVSWYWSYTIDRAEVSSLSLQNYNGFVIGWSGAVDLYSSNVLMIAIQTEDGERRFPATAMRRSTAQRAITYLGEALGLHGHHPVSRRSPRRHLK
ncbi:hypothetical protein SAMN05428970_3193 [Agromyces sp. CF514]|uniref:hypothetical protein n=1 Tax=Agromyces sp. CF514 TaxID=1881031 RepID=UPI0008F12D24|nr:hypothetical protein [Agromyces sp. CF514]SFR85558.1 hypothetical protein SAMN05428970_3193 [Agromyces sp. CF514]